MSDSPTPTTAALPAGVRCQTAILAPMLDGAPLAACVAVARVEAGDGSAHEELARTWLGAEEQERYRRFLVETARRDFLAGRVAAKSALHSLAPGPQNPGTSWQVVRGAWQQPRVRGPVAGLAVTLTHAGGFGVAVAADDRWCCGIDLESAGHAAIDTIASQVSEAEGAWARAAQGVPGIDDAAARWLALWTGREAFGKLLGTGLGLPEALLPLTDWRRTDHGWRAALAGNESFAIQTVVSPVGVLSLACPAGSFRGGPAVDLERWLAAALRP